MIRPKNGEADEPYSVERYTFKELSRFTWPDFEKLFAKHNGVWGGCWCMFYHQQGNFPLGGRVRAERNWTGKHDLVSQGKSHGIIVYSNRLPVGWCQYGTREELPRLDASPTYLRQRPYKGKKRLWRITCFFVDRDFRGRGVASFALKTALASIRRKGGGEVEAYPLQSLRNLPQKTAKGKASFLWSGTVPMFRTAGFKVVAPLGKSRRLMRRTLTQKQP